MTEALTREAMIRRVVAAAEDDPRIVGLADYGSSSEGRADEWSDVDLAVFVRDDDLEPFERQWKTWAARFGPLLLAYISGVDHPWTVYVAIEHGGWNISPFHHFFRCFARSSRTV